MVDDTDEDESSTDARDTDELEQRAVDESLDILHTLAEYDDSVTDPEAERFGVLTVALSENPDADDGSCESFVCVEAESPEQKDRLHGGLAAEIVRNHEPLAAEIVARMLMK
jgi:hypothetical protein